ncbi:1-aminocyclopropane-1-carboxylate deaminase/D-cysteine desulfhydrase [Lacibacter sp. H407]|uniref:1-aminocyclopropane-1-carboxylate deaminase/D-cysteine desulfhydrase n=1 Tax=Lacibacter sp. H407 TaxID=3133423 RepID=UPI0030BF3D58
MQTDAQKIYNSPVTWELNNGLFFSFIVARLDLLHPFVSGNKFFKLKYNLQRTIAENKQGIVTMGGAYSNHLAATAWACYENKLTSVGIIRGDIQNPLNNTLLFCQQHGMKLIAVDRGQYHRSSAIVQQIIASYDQYFFVPEGGDNEEGLQGCTEILSFLKDADSFTHIVCCMGTGTTFQGISRAAASDQTVIGIPVLKIKEADQLLFQQQQISNAAAAKQVILFDHAGAGYAKTSAQQLDFMNLFYQKTTIPTDIVYTGKLMQAVLQLAEQNYFTAADKVVVLHTGGLQGNNSIADGRLLF